MKRLTRKTVFQLESLESRRLLSALTVTNAADSGVGSLRERIAAAQSGDSINFDPGLAGQTITLTSGGLEIAKNLLIQGPGADQLTIDADYASGIFWISGSTSNVQIRDLTITRGSGAIYNAGILSVSNSTLSACGSAIINAGTLNLSSSTLSGNIASEAGGAVYSVAGAVTVSNCTFFDNHAIGRQVGIYDPDSWVYLGTEGYDAYGGAMYVGGGTARIDHSTFVGNSAEGGYGDLRQGAGFCGALTGGQVSDSIIAGNYASYSPDGGFTSLGHNLIGNSRDAIGFLASDLLDVDPHLGPLQNNGGPTQTMALLLGSPAINAGDNTNAPAYDQRGAGFPRIVGGTIDIGAFESDNGPDYTGLRISDVTATEGNTGTVNAAVTVTLSAPVTSTVTVNFATSDNSATVAGGDYDANSGTLNFSPGQTSRTIFITVKGDHTVEPDEQFYVNLTGATNAYLFDPQGVVTIVDDEPGFSVGDASVTEGNTGATSMTFIVTLSAPYDVATTVDFATSDGSATIAGGDYLATSGTLTFNPGQTSKSISIPVNGDRIAEGNEQFYVNLSGASSSFVLDEQGVMSIVDDEPRVSISNASVTEGNSGTLPMTFTATLSAAYDVATSVNFNTASGSAISGKDFDATTGTITFLPGQTSKTLSVPVRGDGIDEYDESFTVNLTGSTNLVILDAEGTATIVDDDAPPAIVISDVSRAEGNSGTTAFAFTVSKLTPSEKTIFVEYSTANGSATSSTAGNKQDYQPISQWGVHLYPDSMSGRVFVYVIGDTRSENDETFFVNLSQPVNATIADAQGVGTILNDEGGRGKNWVGGASGGSWGTAANWSPSGVPGNDSLVSISGASVNLPASASVSELSLHSGATLMLAPSGNRVFRTAGLFLDPDTTLNLNDNGLILDYNGSSPQTQVHDLLVSGRSGGTWNGSGITSSAATAVSGTGLGYAEADDVFAAFPASFGGQSVDQTSILVRYTQLGDANLDLGVDVADLGILASNWQGTGRTFSQGDFDYSGSVDVNDLGILASHWQQVLAAPSAPAARPFRASAGVIDQLAL